MDPDDVRMPQRRRQFSFPGRAAADIRIAGDCDRQDVERLTSWQPWMFREVDLTHCARSKPLNDGEASELFTPVKAMQRIVERHPVKDRSAQPFVATTRRMLR